MSNTDYLSLQVGSICLLLFVIGTPRSLKGRSGSTRTPHACICSEPGMRCKLYKVRVNT
jgi:hypothetical protein